MHCCRHVHVVAGTAINKVQVVWQREIASSEIYLDNLRKDLLMNKQKHLQMPHSFCKILGFNNNNYADVALDGVTWVDIF